MAADIAPALLARIQEEFNRRVRKGKILRLSARIRDGTAKQAEVFTYSTMLGEALSEALKVVLTEDALPDGRLYYNIASRTIRPMLMGNYRLVNDAAIAAQKAIDEENGLGLNALSGDEPTERIENLVSRAASEEVFGDMCQWLEEPIVNATESFYDDFQVKNADFRAASGLRVMIVRSAARGACSWCSNLAGSYEYGKEIHAGDDVFKRHLFCRCVITQVSERTGRREDVWSRAAWREDPQALEARRSIGADIFRLTREQAAAAAARVEQDIEIARIMRTRHVSRDTARRAVKRQTQQRALLSGR